MEKIQALEARSHYMPAVMPDIPYPKPYFIVPLKEHFTVEESHILHLECRVEPWSDPQLTIEWFLNGIPAEWGSRFMQRNEFGYILLDIKDVCNRDSGIWTCKAKNLQGEAFTSTTIVVVTKDDRIILETLHPEGQRGLDEIERLEESLRRKEAIIAPEDGRPPVFTSQPKPLANMSEGDSAHFEARLEPIGDQTMQVEWFFNGQPLKQGHRARTFYAFGFVLLEIIDIRFEDMGEYVCRATNKWGQASTSVTLGIVHREKGEKPKFLSQLRSVSVREGSSAHYECMLVPKTDPDLIVKWYHNGQELRESSRIKTLNDFGFVLMDILFVNEKDAGEYVCVATNKYGTDMTRCTLEVTDIGANVLRDPLQPNSLEQIAHLESHSRYQKSTIKEDYIEQAPKFITQIRSVTNVSESHSAHFEAQLTPTNDPNLKVEWYHNGKLLPSGHRFRTFHDFGIVILDILDLFFEDSGEYMCKATNRLGSDTTSATLTVKAKKSVILDPQIPSDMASNERIQEIEEMRSRKKRVVEEEIRREAPVFVKQLDNPPHLREGENARLRAKVTPTNDPELRIEWYKNGQPLLEANRIISRFDFGVISMDIICVRPDDSGIYTCRAVNEVGEAVSTCTIQVEGEAKKFSLHEFRVNYSISLLPLFSH